MKNTKPQKTGRPNLGRQETIIIKVTDSERQLLVNYSERVKLNKSEIIRQALNEYITRHSDTAFTIPMFK